MKKAKIAKSLISKFLIFSLAVMLLGVFSPVFAQGATKPSSTVNKDAQTKKEKMPLAKEVNDCHSRKVNNVETIPRNCLFLEEPIGGKAGWDLYFKKCTKTSANQQTTEICTTSLWRGGAMKQNTKETLPKGETDPKKITKTTEVTYHGPIQAILGEDASKPYQGPFVLLYGYLGLVYNYMSGLIVGVAVLFIVVGGIQIATTGGDADGREAGKKRIQKAILGLILWFTASLILYAINPTFFSF